MKKITSVFCILLMLALPVSSFALEETEDIPEYELWNYPVTADMGSCRGCDPKYSFKYNFDIRMEELKASNAPFVSSGNNAFKDFSISDILIIGALSLAGGFVVYSMLVEQSEFIKVSF